MIDMTDKEIAEKKEELEALMVKLEMGGNWWPQGFVVYSDELDEVWQFIEELIKEVEKKTEEDLIGEYGTFGMRPED